MVAPLAIECYITLHLNRLFNLMDHCCLMPPQDDDRRQGQPRPETELYKLGNIKKFIEQERRHDERLRLHEARAQRKLWLQTITLCGLLNLLLIGLATWGLMR